MTRNVAIPGRISAPFNGVVGDFDIITGAILMATQSLIDSSRTMRLNNGSTIFYGLSGTDMSIAGSDGQEGIVITAQGATADSIKFFATQDVIVQQRGLRRSASSGIVASTTQTQGQQALTEDINEVATVANANDVVTLRTARTGGYQTVINNGANALQIFPASGDNLGVGVDTSEPLASGSNKTYLAYDTTNWEVTADGIADEKLRFFADQLDNPNSADWTVNALAPAAADSNNAGLTVRLFDDTTEEGVGFITEIPSGKTNIKLSLRSRAETGPAGAVAAVPKLYNRGIPDDAAVQAWSAGTLLSAISLPITTEFFQYDTQIITLASMGITAGEVTQFELTRVGTDAGDTLVGDWALLELIVEFT